MASDPQSKTPAPFREEPEVYVGNHFLHVVGIEVADKQKISNHVLFWLAKWRGALV